MKVKWTVKKPINKIPEAYSDKDLSLFDEHYEGEIIAGHKELFCTAVLIVACTDGEVREVSINDVTVID